MRAHSFKLATVFFAIVAAVGAQASFYQEDFESWVPPSGWDNNYYTYGNVNGPSFAANGTWNVTGSIDIVGVNHTSVLPLDKYGVDLAGTPAGPGKIERTFAPSAVGQYQVKFFLKAGNLLSDLTTFQAFVNNMQQVAPLTSLGSDFYSFTFNGSISSLAFGSTATNYGNLIFDDLSVEAVPEPFTMALGVAGIGLALRRRSQKTSL